MFMIDENHQVSWDELRDVALSRARMLLIENGINPCDVKSSAGLDALRDFAPTDPEHYASLWYVHSGGGQRRLFAQNWKTYVSSP